MQISLVINADAPAMVMRDAASRPFIAMVFVGAEFVLHRLETVCFVFPILNQIKGA